MGDNESKWVAEVATLQLEFRYLSHLTWKVQYCQWRRVPVAEKVRLLTILSLLMIVRKSLKDEF